MGKKSTHYSMIILLILNLALVKARYLKGGGGGVVIVESDGLSTGAKIGIAIGSFFGFFVLACCLSFCSVVCQSVPTNRRVQDENRREQEIRRAEKERIARMILHKIEMTEKAKKQQELHEKETQEPHSGKDDSYEAVEI